jgi:hypothetical protein
MSANGLKGAEAGKTLGDAIATNTVLKELDISGSQYDDQKCDVEFVQAFSVGLRDNGAMLLLNLSNNALGPEGVLITCETLLNDARFDTTNMHLMVSRITMCHICD